MPNNPTPLWTLIIVPPTAMAAPRRLGMKKRTVRRVVFLAVIALVAPWLWTFVASENAGRMADRLAVEQRLTAALSDTVESLRAASLAAARAARRPPADMRMPVTGEITSRFSRSRLHPILHMFRSHRGVDLAAPSGARIHAPAAGKVIAVQRRLGFGLTIEIAHTGGVVTRYAHCQLALVLPGDNVVVGQAIGAVGSTGLATGPHLHFELLVNGVARDPIKFIASTHRTPLAPPGSAIDPTARTERAEHHD